MTVSRWVTVAASTLLVTTRSIAAPSPEPRPRWGSNGHEMAARAAARVLPDEMPDFFRAATERLIYLGPEPDRWRAERRGEMRAAWAPDHYVNFENLPDGALDAAHRYEYLAVLQAAGVDRPDERAGFLPFAIVERYQRLVTEWELWRAESDPVRRAWIEDRIVNDGGILGHFVTDGLQPLHTTIHYNGWADGAPNPDGYPRDRTLHARFETGFVDVHVGQREVSSRVRPPTPLAGDVRAAVVRYVRDGYARVEELYRLDRDIGFDPRRPADPRTVDFTADRLAAGAQMLATLWLSAWEESR